MKQKPTLSHNFEKLILKLKDLYQSVLPPQTPFDIRLWPTNDAQTIIKVIVVEKVFLEIYQDLKFQKKINTWAKKCAEQLTINQKFKIEYLAV